MDSVSIERQQQVAKRGLLNLELSASKQKLLGDIFNFVALTLGGLFMALPFIWMVSSSLKPINEIYVFPPEFVPRDIQWINYVEIFRRLPFHLFFQNSIIVSGVETIGVLVTASMAGYAFARLRFPARDKIFLLYLSTMMISFAVRMIPLFVLMRTFGWVDKLHALYIPGMFSAWGTFLMRQFMITIPKELEDAAFIDGATRVQIYYKIIVPLTKPALATLGIFHFMGSWNAFLWPLIILSSMENRTLPLGLAAFRAMVAMKTPWHLVMSASVISILPVLIIFILGQKYYVRGIVTTGLKG